MARIVRGGMEQAVNRCYGQRVKPLGFDPLKYKFLQHLQQYQMNYMFQVANRSTCHLPRLKTAEKAAVPIR